MYSVLADDSRAVKLSSARIEEYRRLYGDQAAKRLDAWQRLIRESANLPEHEKLKRVNRFFNQVRFLDDIVHWKKKDYWATPVEFLISNGGDCEDFSIAKYYTLRALGVADEKMSLAYVKALELNQAHMVLTYYDTPQSMPLVLDNLIGDIRPANERPDLLHVYTFNGDSLWLSKRGRRAELVGTSDRLAPWVKLRDRIQQNDVNLSQSQEP
ncbi:transglutaminase-like cysteine peptidase [Marinobacterium sp. AK62]|uniref:Transglutaminase-like cysteine peptidase n=1 Tax=Marinobacterium alkalitolerans TaxID=1542925 RepID=A0ABS3ZD85_9GAMM|nr:transglutaminase-like cysteine peptidase [Marinobacterium alkalitolerans]MBP0048989.1 transglutaminase-like cysteine peptidase [Marinobacterium alkalitolerans]